MSLLKAEHTAEALAYAQSIIDTVRDPLLVLDIQLRVVTASRAFCLLFCVTKEETEGQLIYALDNSQWDILPLRQALEVVLPQQSSFDELEVTHQFSTIGERTILLNARKIWRQHNHSELILLAMQDITERKRSEQKLAEAHRALQDAAADFQRSNADLESFARIAGHDLRAPLNSIVQFSQLLDRRYKSVLDEDAQLYLQYIVDGGLRMSQLLTDLLQYSLLSQSPIQSLSCVSANQACQQAVDNLNAAICETSAKVGWEMAEEVQVRVESSMLVLLFQNLIGNGIHYRRANVKPVIQLTAASQGEHWVFAVKDNGIGIEKAHFQEVFEPFRRLHGPEKPGSGIGLATCKRVVERAGGALWVDSIPNEGSTFYFLLLKSA